MTTDELLAKLPSHIGNHEVGDCYVLTEPDDDIQWLNLHQYGKGWCASYGIEGEFLCLGQMENGMYDNAFAYGSTPNEALHGLYDWCLRHGFIKEKANEAPEKIYLQEPTKVRTEKKYDNDIEYTRTDAFIEKACEYLYNYNQKQALKHGARAILGCGEYTINVDDFRKYVKGE